MKVEISEVIKWYEEQFGRPLTQLERACVRNQCILYNQVMPKENRLKNPDIRLAGLNYGGMTK